MNFISEMEGQEIHVDLKYCERCGGLWLRPQGNPRVHCASCHLSLTARGKSVETSAEDMQRRGPRPPGTATPRRGARRQTHIESLQGVAVMQVQR